MQNLETVVTLKKNVIFKASWKASIKSPEEDTAKKKAAKRSGNSPDVREKVWVGAVVKPPGLQLRLHEDQF